MPWRSLLGTWVHVFNLSPDEFWNTTAIEFDILAQEWLARNKTEEPGMSYDDFMELEKKIDGNRRRSSRKT